MPSKILTEKTISSLKSMTSRKFEIGDEFISKVSELTEQTLNHNRTTQSLEDYASIIDEIIRALTSLPDYDYDMLESALISYTTGTIGTGKFIAPFSNAKHCKSGWLLKSMSSFSSKYDCQSKCMKNHRPIEHREQSLRKFIILGLIDIFEGVGHKITPYGFFGEIYETLTSDPKLSGIGAHIKAPGQLISEIMEERTGEVQVSDLDATMIRNFVRQEISLHESMKKNLQ